MKRPRLLPLLVLVALAGCRSGTKRPAESPALKHHRQAFELAQKGNPAGAEEAWRTAIALDPKFAPAYFALADFYERTGHPAIAAECLAPLRKADPTVGHVECRRADLYFQADGYEMVVLLAREALRREPACPLAHLMEAIVLSGAGRRAEALQHLRAAHASAPGDERFVLPLAQALGEDGKIDEAISLVRPLLATSPARTRVRYLLGSLLRRSAKPAERQEARRLLDEALKLNPGYAPARAERGRLLAQGGDLTGGRREMEAALSAGFTDPDLVADLASLLARTGSKDAVAAQATARQGRAMVEALQKARARYLDEPEDMRNNVALAGLEGQRGNVPDALALVQQVLKQNPDDPEALKLVRVLSARLPRTP